jgi:quinoprotein glucose dehydrogenase
MQNDTLKASLLVRIFAVALILLALPLLFGGVYLLSLGGSCYYAISGLVLAVSAILLFKNKLLGASLFGLFFVATLLWTVFEAKTRFWAYVPRLAVFAVLAFVLSLLLPRIGQGVSRKVAYSLSAVLAACFVIAVGIAFSPQYSFVSEQAFPTQALAGDANDPSQADSDWTHYGRDSNATRYSPLTQINVENVQHLQRAWVYHTGDLPAPGQANKWAAESTPIKVGNGLYICSATNNVSRLDPATGKELWKFKSGVKYASIPYTAACRGLTYYESKVIPRGQKCHTRIILGTLDMRLFAIDSETGEFCEGFGNKGQTDLNKGMGPVTPGFVSVTSPLPVVNDTVIINQEVRDNQRRFAPSGVIRGYDAETGQFKWAWDVKRPHDKREPAQGQQYSRGTPNSWSVMTGDDQLGLVYIPMGNAAADHYTALRSAEEEAVNSAVVALDAKTGDVRWVFNTVHKDVWDMDLGSQATLINWPDQKGQLIPALLMPTKLGQTFVLNRMTGKPLTRVVEQAVPTKGGPADDPRSATQPISVDIPRLGFDDLNETKMWGISPIDQMMCRIKYRQANYQGRFTPLSVDKPFIMYPGNNGGSDWGSYAYDANHGVIIANWNNTAMYGQLIPRSVADQDGLKSMDDPHYKNVGGTGRPMAETPYGVRISAFFSPTGMLCSEPPYGMISAIDLHSKKILWQHPLGSAERNGPFNLATHLPINIGTPNNGGPIITAGTLPAGGQATPMTYSINGEQYLVIMAGGHHFMKTGVSDALVAYKLPKN